MADEKPNKEIQEAPKAISIEPGEAPAKPKPSDKPKAKPSSEAKVELKRKKNPKAVFKSFLPK